MDNYTVSKIDFSFIDKVLPLIKILNKKTSDEMLIERFRKMFEMKHYECIGLFNRGQLIGICGLWYLMRHYGGYSCEPDHVIINSDYQSKGLGRFFFAWIETYLIEKKCDLIELNSYTSNTRSHKFYYNEGFSILGFHFIKKI